MAKNTKSSKTAKITTKQTGTRGTILGLPIEDQLVTREISRTTKKAAKAPKTKEKAVKVEAKKQAPKEPLNYRVFQIPVALWDSLKQKKGESSAHEFITEAVDANLPKIVAALESLGIQKQEMKKIRVARPSNWQKLLDASEYTGGTIPAQTLMALAIYWQLNPSVRGSK